MAPLNKMHCTNKLAVGMDLLAFLGCEGNFGCAGVTLIMVATLVEDETTVAEVWQQRPSWSRLWWLYRLNRIRMWDLR